MRQPRCVSGELAQSAAGQKCERVHPLSRPVSLGWIAPDIPTRMK